MSALPKLNAEQREHIAQVVKEKRSITVKIRELMDQRRQLPTVAELCSRHNVSRKVVGRILYGEPYRTKQR